jgi:hypothetical protein
MLLRAGRGCQARQSLLPLCDPLLKLSFHIVDILFGGKVQTTDRVQVLSADNIVRPSGDLLTSVEREVLLPKNRHTADVQWQMLQC